MSLSGKRIVNTRAAHQAEEFNTLLHDAGAIPLEYPCIAIDLPKDTALLDTALRNSFDFIVLTSVNTVLMLAYRLRTLGLSLNGVKAAAVGMATAQAARKALGVEISVMPDEFTADALAQGLTITPGMRIFLPQSEIARTELAENLRARGAKVTAVTAYQTVRGVGGVALVPMLRDKQVDAVTLTSSSTARYFVERIGDEGGADLSGVPIACIGPETSRTARECGFTVAVEAKTHTLAGMVEALAIYFEEHT